MKAHEPLADKSKWTSGAYARNVSGAPVLRESADASCWCASGAIAKCYGIGTPEYTDAYCRASALASRWHQAMMIEGVNDTLGYDAVMQVLREADV